MTSEKAVRPTQETVTLVVSTAACLRRGVAAAIAIFTECAEIARRAGLRVGEMVACNAVGVLLEERAVLDEARRFWERTL